MVRWSPLVALVLSWATFASAEPSEEAVRFQYVAPSACPDADGFTARVRERTPRGRIAEPGELARTFSVELTPDAQGFMGTIEFLDDGGAKVSRRVHGEQCDAVVSSLALITALALDAALREEAEGPPPEPERTPVPAPPPVAVSPAPAAPPTPAKAARRSLRGARVGVMGGYDGAVHATSIGLLGQLDWQSGFALRMSAHYAWNQFNVDAGRAARLQLAGLETSVCPWRLEADALALAPCADLDLGTLHAAGVGSPTLVAPGSKTILWASVGAELRVSWEPAAPFWVELRGAVGFPLAASYRFTFEKPANDVYEVPYISGSGALAAGVRFW